MTARDVTVEQSTLYINVGGNGTGPRDTPYSSGGFNGGGNGGTTSFGGGGGGASDVRTVSAADDGTLGSRLVVAAGGGGSGGGSSVAGGGGNALLGGQAGFQGHWGISGGGIGSGGGSGGADPQGAAGGSGGDPGVDSTGGGGGGGGGGSTSGAGGGGGASTAGSGGSGTASGGNGQLGVGGAGTEGSGGGGGGYYGGGAGGGAVGGGGAGSSYVRDAAEHDVSVTEAADDAAAQVKITYIRPSDTTPPVITCPSSPVFTLGETEATLTATASDENSGVDPAQNNLTAQLDTSSVGPKTTTVTATDNAGNTATASCDYRVWYTYELLSPAPHNNIIKAGKTIPIQFSVGGDQGLNIFSEPPTVAYYTCGTTPEGNTAATGSGPTYKARANTYTYSWASPKNSKGCATLSLHLNDGTTQTVDFNFR
ncbi:PxKF domain-containing protein [Streptomyces sp. NPDC126514]|uniref:PxKF domain-containing protein n=1 Tax=Streptomyces sp. NPDC126514 TaxID=3155210 RepID=UPI00331706AC